MMRTPGWYIPVTPVTELPRTSHRQTLEFSLRDTAHPKDRVWPLKCICCEACIMKIGMGRLGGGLG
jgi:hypothetical protein